MELRGEDLPCSRHLRLAAIVARGTIQRSARTSIATHNGWLLSIAGAGLAALRHRLHG